MTGYFEAKPFKHQFITQAPGEFFLKKRENMLDKARAVW